MATKYSKTVNAPCSDWMRSWGFGPTNHIGKLRKGEPEGTYIWRGHQQGRHGQMWNQPANITFRVVSDTPFEIEIIDNPRKRSLPDYRDIQEAIKILNS